MDVLTQTVKLCLTGCYDPDRYCSILDVMTKTGTVPYWTF